jgi:uncharacterized protein (DUF697 family)
MIATIAHICGYDVKSHQVKTLAIACLCGDTVAEPLKAAGITMGSKLTANLINQIPGTALIGVNKAVGFRLLAKAGPTAVVNLSKFVPIIGGIVFGGFDATATYTIGKTAKNLFYATEPPEQPDAPASPTGTE